MFCVIQVYAWDLPINKTAIHRNSENPCTLLNCQSGKIKHAFSSPPIHIQYSKSVLKTILFFCSSVLCSLVLFVTMILEKVNVLDTVCQKILSRRQYMSHLEADKMDLDFPCSTAVLMMLQKMYSKGTFYLFIILGI